MAGLSLSLLLVVGLVAWAVLDDEPYVAPAPTTPQRTAAPALASETLAALVAAVEDGRPESAESLADPDDEQAQAQLATLVENGRAARVEDFSLRYVDEMGAVADDGTWHAAVDAAWAFRGFDRAPALSEVRFGFRVEDEHAVLTSIGGGDRRSPLWMTTPLDVSRTRSTLVLNGAGPGQVGRFAGLAERAVPAVRAVLPGWQPRLVVEVPPTAAALDRSLDSEAGEYAKIAAVTSTADGSLAPDAPVHVFVNPEVFAGLKPRGAQVVMSHEAVHVATDAATSAMPLWLLEGFADYVALLDIDLPSSVTAGQIIRRVRRDGPPAALPGPAEFDTSTSYLGASYESAWLACRLLADIGGQDELVKFYRDVDSGTSVAAALESHYGLTEREFTNRWRDLLRDLAA